MSNDKVCYFEGAQNICQALHGQFCRHDYRNCSFYKTIDEYINDRNHAILINRQKGNCENCKYMSIKCQLIGEKSNKFGSK